MHEVKSPKKPLISYYIIIIAILLLFNLIAMPRINQMEIEEMDYGTFMRMTEKKQIGQVDIRDNEIIFTNKSGSKIYRTGLMEDPDRTQRLYDSGAVFSSEIVEETSPWITMLLSWILPLLIFIGIGQYLSKKLMEKAGGGANSMMFGMGKSNAKIYVKSSSGIKFSDVAGEDEAKENLTEIVEWSHCRQ